MTTPAVVSTAEYGRRAGAVGDAVRRLKREWLDLLEDELATAGSTQPADDALQLDALLAAGNTRHQLWGSAGDLGEIDRAARLAMAIIPGPAAG